MPVYLAQDHKLERNVALKILPHDLVKDEERVRAGTRSLVSRALSRLRMAAREKRE